MPNLFPSSTLGSDKNHFKFPVNTTSNITDSVYPSKQSSSHDILHNSGHNFGNESPIFNPNFNEKISNDATRFPHGRSSSQNGLSTENSPTLSTYKSVITPIKLSSFSEDEACESVNIESENKMDVPPCFKSNFARLLSSSSGKLFDPTISPTKLDNTASSISHNNLTTDKTEQNSNVCQTNGSEQTFAKEPVLNSLTSNLLFDALQGGKSIQPPVSMMYSYTQVDELCHKLLESSNQKLKSIADEIDFSSSKFNSSFDEMFDSIIEEQSCDTDTYFDSPSLECSMESKKSVSFEMIDVKKDENYSDNDDASSILSEDSCHTSSKSKICEDEMDVDFFLSSDSESKNRNSSVKQTLEKIESFKETESSMDSPVSSLRMPSFEAIPEGDEDISSNSSANVSPLPDNISTSSRFSLTELEDTLVRPNNLPLFSDMSGKEINLQSPKRSKNESTTRSDSLVLNGNFIKNMSKSPLKLSPFKPRSTSSSDFENINCAKRRIITDDNNITSGTKSIDSILIDQKSYPIGEERPQSSEVNSLGNHERCLSDDPSWQPSKIPSQGYLDLLTPRSSPILGSVSVRSCSSCDRLSPQHTGTPRMSPQQSGTRSSPRVRMGTRAIARRMDSPGHEKKQQGSQSQQEFLKNNQVS